MKDRIPVTVSVIRYLALLVLGIAVLSGVQAAGLAVDTRSIENPKPNLFEKDYGRLRPVKTIAGEVAPGQYLLNAYSVTADDSGNIYVYDNLQVKILKFDAHQTFMKAFGKRGTGPGEFHGDGVNYRAIIKIGPDGNLYAQELNSKRIIVFNTEGDRLREFPYPPGERYDYIAPDSNGTVYFHSLKNGSLTIVDQAVKARSVLLPDEDTLKFLFFAPNPRFPLGTQINLGIGADSKIIVYFCNSSSLYVMRAGKWARPIRVWPKDGLESYKLRYAEGSRRHPNGYSPMFSNLLVDSAEDCLYLQFGWDKEKGAGLLYKLDLAGNLKKVLLVDDNAATYLRFFAKKNAAYYGIKDGKVLIYKEV